jgi:ATP-dependent helicase HrpB
VLAVAATERLTRALPPADSTAAQYLTRLRCLCEWMPELELTSFDEDELRELVPILCRGARSLEEVRNGRWVSALQGKLTPLQRQAVEREAPERMQVPSGSRVTLHYEVGRPPVLAVRLQELFGLRDTPRIAGGRVRVLLHLLAPNFRPQQITDDLASFWTNAYPQVRGELRRRYPKHAWPEDPLSAQAVRGTRARRGDAATG